MPRSLANGDYSLLMAIESSSRPDSWYRVVADRRTGTLSCDCLPFLFKRDAQAVATGVRTCAHTRLGQLLTAQATPPPLASSRRAGAALGEGDPLSLLAATQRQWPGLRGQWSIDGRLADVHDISYQFILLRLEMGNGGIATGVVAFAERHHPSEARLQAGVAGWAGYSIASEVARQGGYPLAGQPPEHFKISTRSRRPQAPGSQPSRAEPTTARPTLPQIGLRDILRVGDQVDLGDGLVPTQRAENTLRMFLGEQLYQQLEQRHFLDVSSVRYAQRVYRVRRDPMKRGDRRVRVFEQGSYSNDFCIIRAQEVPEADHWLTVWLGLLSDERQTLSVVQNQNIFGQYSDVHKPVIPIELETVPAIWLPRVA